MTEEVTSLGVKPLVPQGLAPDASAGLDELETPADEPQDPNAPKEPAGDVDEGVGLDAAIIGELAKFGVSDPGKATEAELRMAKSTLHGSRKISQLGAENATLRQISQSGPLAPREPEPEALTPQALLEQVAEVGKNEGGDQIETLINGINRIVEEKINAAIQPLQIRTQSTAITTMEREFKTRYPDAEQIADGMGEVLKESPFLIPSEGTQEDIFRGMEFAYHEAKRRAGAPSAPAEPPQPAALPRPAPTIKRGVVDAGRTSRRMPAGDTPDETKLGKLMSNAKATGRESDWTRVMSAMLARGRQRS